MYYPTIDYNTFRENLHIYILLFSIVLVLTIFVYIKLVYPFWNTQPVYHSYDFWRSLSTKPFIIQRRYPVKTRYCDFDNVLTYNILDISSELKQDIINLLQCHYLSSENAMYMFHTENFRAIFAGHLYNPYISLFKEKYFTKKIKNSDTDQIEETIEVSEKPIGCITSRSLDISLKGENIKVHFIDLLCIHREHAKRKLTRQLLQTHDYNIRCSQLKENGKEGDTVLVSLFKKEVDLCQGIVPLIEYETPIYLIGPELIYGWISPNGLPPHFLLIEIDDKNIGLVLEFLSRESIKKTFDVFGISGISNILEQVKSRTLYIYCLKKMEYIYTIYFFRDTRVQYEFLTSKNQKTGALLVLIASIQNCNNQELFIQGFSMSLQSIIKKQNTFCFCMIENLSHNFIIIDSLEEISFQPIIKNKSAYYFYNYVVPARFSVPSRIFIVV